MTGTTQQVRSQGFAVLDCDIPEGMTLAEYRASRGEPQPAPRRRRFLPRLKRRA